MRAFTSLSKTIKNYINECMGIELKKNFAKGRGGN